MMRIDSLEWGLEFLGDTICKICVKVVSILRNRDFHFCCRPSSSITFIVYTKSGVIAARFIVLNEM